MYLISETGLSSDFRITDVTPVTPLGTIPVVSSGLLCWFSELLEFADFINPILPRRYTNA